MFSVFQKMKDGIAALEAEADHSKTTHELMAWFKGASHEIIRQGEKEALTLLPVAEAGAKSVLESMATKSLGGVAGQIAGAVAASVIDAAANTAQAKLGSDLEDSAPEVLDTTGGETPESNGQNQEQK